MSDQNTNEQSKYQQMLSYKVHNTNGQKYQQKKWSKYHFAGIMIIGILNVGILILTHFFHFHILVEKEDKLLLQLADKWIKMRAEEEEKSRPLELVISKPQNLICRLFLKNACTWKISREITQYHDKTE